MKQKLMSMLRLTLAILILIIDATILLPYQVFHYGRMLYFYFRDRTAFREAVANELEGGRVIGHFIATGKFDLSEEGE